MRNRVSRGLYLGPPIHGNYHLVNYLILVFLAFWYQSNAAYRGKSDVMRFACYLRNIDIICTITTVLIS